MGQKIDLEIKKHLNANDNENTKHLCDAAKVGLRREVQCDMAFLQKQENSQVNNQTYHLKTLKEKRTNKNKVSRR